MQAISSWSLRIRFGCIIHCTGSSLLLRIDSRVQTICFWSPWSQRSHRSCGPHRLRSISSGECRRCRRITIGWFAPIFHLGGLCWLCWLGRLRSCVSHYSKESFCQRRDRTLNSNAAVCPICFKLRISQRPMCPPLKALPLLWLKMWISSKTEFKQRNLRKDANTLLIRRGGIQLMCRISC